MKIESIKIKKMVDECPDTSFIGEYTDDADDWNICRHCGEYVHHAEKWDCIIDSIEYDQMQISNQIGYGTTDEDRRWTKIYDAMQVVIGKFSKNIHDCPQYSGQYNYFRPYAGGEKAGSKEYQKYGLQDYERIEQLNAGDWGFIGIGAEATISYAVGSGDRRLETLKSGGLWGIESDSGDYLVEIAKEELADLKSHLEEFGIDTDKGFDELAKTAIEEMD